MENCKKSLIFDLEDSVAATAFYENTLYIGGSL